MSKLLHDLLTESAKKYPDKPSVVYKDKQLTYNDLNVLSDQLSAVCLNSGVEKGGRVGIYIDKSIDAVIAIFSILKSGACYVPLDPLAPVDRQVLIINDCALEYLITSSGKLSHVRQILQHSKYLKNVFVIDVDRKDCKDQIAGINLFFKDDIYMVENNGKTKTGNGVTDSALAYILYTSGSTGQPKGVMISHKAASAFVDWGWNTFDISDKEVMSSHAPLHFDLSIFDIFVAVKAGATICLVHQGLSSFPRSIVDFIENNKISTWYSVPSILTQLVLYGKLEERKLPSLKRILFAGEVFPSKYLRKLMELLPDIEYYNLYGPTETNVITYYKVTEPPGTAKPIPIGILCDGVESFVVNKSGSLVEDGERGELHVSGPTLMGGYWNDLKKTEGVLFPNPFDSSIEPLYKTGDIVSLKKGGNFAYHGRSDHMIKSRGYRIEIGEIESAFHSHAGINEVAVVAIPDDKIGNIIKAVVTGKADSELSEKEIRSFCLKKLPNYMVPEIISIIDSLPRTSTGKIDRKKLENDDI